MPRPTQMHFSKEVCYFPWASCVRRWIKAESQAIRKHKQDIHSQHCNSGEIFLGPSRLLQKVHSGFFQNCRTIKSVIREELTVSMELKALLLREPIVAYSDFTVPFRLYMDASNIVLGAILAQQQDRRERVICCASQTLNKAEQNYSATKKECFSVVWGIKNFKNYLIANHFKVYTNHYSLSWLRAMKNQSALLHQWAAQLEDYFFETLHRPGKNQGHVDTLSRLSLEHVSLLGTGKVTLTTEEETREVFGKNSYVWTSGSLKSTTGFPSTI